MPDFTNKTIYDDILEFSKQQAALGLLDTGVDVNFFEPVLKQLNSSVFNGGNIDDLLDELKIYVTGGKDGIGGLERYVKQVANDSLSQFNATYNQTITQDLGLEFYIYTGTIIAGTRPFCNSFVNQYFHKKEVEKLGEGINPLTNHSLTSAQFKGRAKGTNKSTIFTYRGGYGCRHLFSPISDRFVPKDVLKRNIDNGNWIPTQRQKKLLDGKNVVEKQIPIENPVADGFKPAKTIEDAKKWAKENIGIIEDTSKMSLESKNLVNEEIFKLKQKFKIPELTKLGEYLENPNAIAMADTNSLNFTAKFNDIKKLTQTLANDSKTGWTTKFGGNPKAIINHEIGHMLTVKDITGTSIDYAYRAEMRSVYDKYILEMKRLKKQKIDVMSSPNFISRYGATNPHEFYAEAFSDYLNNPTPSKYSKQIYDIILKKHGK